MIIVIRGHIRNSFSNKDLLNLVKLIYLMNGDLKIYIHTWNIFANNLSHRFIEPNENIVTSEIINNYFEDYSHLIKDIIIISNILLYYHYR